jgi:hypothetical protein
MENSTARRAGFLCTGASVGSVRDPDALGDIPKAMKTMFEHYDHRGLPGSPLTLHAILGRGPRTLHAYFEELAAERTSDL